ncbi:Di-copper centre-containing protein [Thozetella sp. PMI_491]|nr:Di-copper centre-containing protein [Thozetella sp. PMI_491]
MYWFVLGALAVPGLAATTRQDSGIIPVVGIKTGSNAVTGEPPARLNINDLRSGPGWDLYIQALAAFQEVPELDERSYFRVSGIHGRPYIPYNGATRPDDAPLDMGYCIHDEILFATWHRPHVLLFEQLLAEHVQAIAAKYTGSDSGKYKAAANAWRQPYWDWAFDKGLPDVLMADNLTVTGPHGNITLPNPLLTYKFAQFPLNETLFPPNDDFELPRFPETVRCPNPWTNQSNEGMASSYVGSVNLAAQVYNVYTRTTAFEGMSSTAWDSTSIESQHNEVHVAVGGIHPVGHFANFPYSGFDPLFMLHHAAIDRHVALWQAIHYNASMFNTTYTSRLGAYATSPGTNISADSPLKPFYADASGRFHTSNSVRDVLGLGYTYPELQGQTRMTRDELRGRVIKDVTRLYGPSPEKQKRSLGTSTKHYFAKVKVDKAEVDLPAFVNFYIGADLAGRFVLPTIPEQGVVHDEIVLEECLSKAKLETRDTRVVVPFLEENLRWEIRKFNGSALPVSQIPSLKVTVVDSDVTLPSTDRELPRYGKTTEWPSITGGLNA